MNANPYWKARVWLAVALLSVAFGCAAGSRADGDRSAVVFVAASMGDAVAALAKRFEAQGGGEIRISAAASSTLARQIEAGAGADLFLSANSAWMDRLAERGLIDSSSRIDLLLNRLALVAHPGTDVDVSLHSGPPLPEKWAGRLALGDPKHVPAGIYAVQALERLGWLEGFKGRLTPARDARDALRLVMLGEVGLGVVYATDAISTDRVRILAILPQELHEPIRCPMALIGQTGKVARDFYRFLRSPEAAVAFRSRGFRPIGASDEL